MTIRIDVDPANPGQFFACCGLLELADRLWGFAEGWFETGVFRIGAEETGASLSRLLEAARDLRLSDGGPSSTEEEDEEEDASEDKTESLTIVSPISIRLDWWEDKSIKTWAGSMKERKIFQAMCSAIDPQCEDPLNQGQVVFDVQSSPLSTKARSTKNGKKREPFYFDGRRGASAWSIDVGFSTDALGINTVAHPVVESLCLIGLQRCRPKPTETPRVFDYFAWDLPLSISIAPLAISGLIGRGDRYRFANSFRTDQKKHKAYAPATCTQRSLI